MQKRQWIVWPSPENESVVRPSDWNEYLLKVEGNHYISRLNGVLMVDYTEADAAIPQRGQFGLQVHGGGKTEVRFKEILIEELP